MIKINGRVWTQRILTSLAVLLILSASYKYTYAENTALVINEIITSNVNTLADEDGDFSDWIELYNTSSGPINLSGYSLSDKADPSLSSWALPNIDLPAGQYLIVFADNKNRRVPGQPLHTSFGVSLGEKVSLLKSGVIVDSVQTGAAYKGQSLGRFPNGTGLFFAFKQPTPARANSTTPTASVPRFSISGGFYSSNQTVSLSAPSASAVIHYTLFKGFDKRGEPIVEQGDYSGPISISKTTVVRAYTTQGGFDPSPMVANTYFINFDPKGLPVVSLVTDRDNFFDPIKGIYVQGVRKDIANFQLDEERPIYIEYYDASRQMKISQSAGVKIHGNNSRDEIPRPLAIYARSTYNAPGKFEYPIYPGKNISEYDSFALRNGSQDGALLTLNAALVKGTFLRNSLMADINRSLDVDFRDSVQVIVFLEGEFWGISNFQEKFNLDYLVNNHPDLVKGHIDLLKIVEGKIQPAQIRVDNPIITRDLNGISTVEYENVSEEARGIDDYLNLINFMKSNDLNNPQNYAHVESRIDMSNFIDYTIAQIYSGNNDWPDTNIRLFRDSTAGSNGLPGRWRYIYADSDVTFNLIPQIFKDNNTFKSALLNFPEFKALMTSEAFKKKFLARLASCLNGTLRNENVLRILNKHKADLEPMIETHLKKWWGAKFTKGMWDSNVANIVTFIQGRNLQLKDFAQSLLNVQGTSQVTVETTPAVGGEVMINDMVLPTATSTGAYFNNIPIVLKAEPKDGYDFESWNVDGNVQRTSQITVTPNGNRTVIANFKSISGIISDGTPALVINEVMGSNGATLADENGSFGDWIELKNVSSNSINTKDVTITDGSATPWVLPMRTLAPGEFLILWADSLNTSSTQGLHTNFNVSAGGETLRLRDGQGNVLDIVDTGLFTRDISNGKNAAGKFVVLDNPSPRANNGNQAPEITSLSPLPDYSVIQGETLNITIVASDPDADTLGYSLTSNPVAFTHFSITGNVLHLAPVVAETGNYRLTLKVTDGRGHEVSQSFNLTVTNPQTASVVINEVMGYPNSDTTDVFDEDGEPNQWIELKNVTGANVDLDGYTISDGDVTWSFPSRIVNSNGYVILWASEKDSNNDPRFVDLHTNFTVGQNGKILTLKDPQGRIIDSISTGRFAQGKSRGRAPDGIGSFVGLPVTTFNSSNGVVAVEQARLVINEAMGKNEGAFVDELGKTPDWIELKNIGSTAIDINGFTISIAGGNAWTIPVSQVVSQGGYVMILADEKSVGLHTNFNISQSNGETITIKDDNGTTLDTMTTGAFDADKSKGRLPDGTGNWILLSSPTPGSNNSLIIASAPAVPTKPIENKPRIVEKAEITSPTSGSTINPLNTAIKWQSKPGQGVLAYTIDMSPTPITTRGSGRVSGVLPVLTTSSQVTSSFLKEKKIYVTLWSKVGPTDQDWLRDDAEYQINLSEDPTLPSPTFSQKDGFYSQSVRLQLATAFLGAQIIYTLDGSEPLSSDNIQNSNILVYTSPLNVSQSTTIRARVLTAQGMSKVVSQTYFIGTNTHGLGVMSLIADPKSLMNIATAQPAEVVFYEPSESLTDSHYKSSGVVKIMGDAVTQGYPQKSLDIVTSTQNEKLLFADKTAQKVNGVLLSNGNQDGLNTFIRQGLLVDIAKDLGLNYSAYRPVIGYINGQYKGLYQMRERMDEGYFKNNFGVSTTDIDVLQVNDLGGLRTSFGQAYGYSNLLKTIENQDLNNNTNYQTVSEQCDIPELIKQTALDIYLANIDAVDHGRMIWRQRSSDRKWKWINTDTLGLNLFSDIAGPDYDSLTYVLNHSILLKKLSANTTFRTALINQMADMLNSIVQPESLHSKVNQLQANIEGEMANHLTQWPGLTVDQWKKNISKIHEFIDARPRALQQNILSYFGLQATSVVHIKNTSTDKGKVILNSLTIEKGDWQGTYFKGVPVNLKALPADGYKLDYWTINGQRLMNSEITLDPDNSLSIEAVFVSNVTVAPIVPKPVEPVSPTPVVPVTPAPVAPVSPTPVVPVTPTPVTPVTPAPVAPTVQPTPNQPISIGPFKLKKLIGALGHKLRE